jgi:hypothetical protein
MAHISGRRRKSAKRAEIFRSDQLARKNKEPTVLRSMAESPLRHPPGCSPPLHSSPRLLCLLMATRRGRIWNTNRSLPQPFPPNSAPGREEESFPLGGNSLHPHVFIPGRLGRRCPGRERSGRAAGGAERALACGASGLTDRCRRRRR